MTDSEKLTKAQEYISQESQKQDSDRIDAFHWEQTPHDQTTKIYRLGLFRGREKSIFTFTEFDLIDNHDSKQWEKQLRSHANDVLTEL